MSPLYRHTSKKSSIDWNPRFETIRQQIIPILKDKPVLTIFHPEVPIELHTNASSKRYGAMLIQKINGKPHVVEYFSRKTSPCE